MVEPGWRTYFADLLRIDRSGSYRQSTVLAKRDAEAVAELLAVHGEHPLYGTRRLALHLGWSRNKARRIRDLAGVTIERPRKRRRGYKSARPEISTPPNILHTYARFKDESRPQDGMDYSGMANAGAWGQDSPIFGGVDNITT